MRAKIILCFLLVALVTVSLSVAYRGRCRGQHRAWYARRPYRSKWRNADRSDERTNDFGGVVSTGFSTFVEPEEARSPGSSEFNKKTASWESMERWSNKQFNAFNLESQERKKYGKRRPNRCFEKFGSGNSQLESLEKFTNFFGFF